MREIKYIVIHCTVTAQTATIEAIKKYWKEVMKWKNFGYHFILMPDGSVKNITPIESIANGVAGFNRHAIHISYIGGVDKWGKPIDNRSPGQIESMTKLVKDLKKKFPRAQIKGHRDFPSVHKACPSFDVAAWLQTI